MSKKQTHELLEVFANPHPRRSYLVEHHVHEFSSLCPKTGQPDFATMLIRFHPGKSCVELRSLKLYLRSYRDRGIFYEDVTNVIADDLERAMQPKWLEVVSTWTTRGGIHSVITTQRGPTAERPRRAPRTR